MIGDHLEQYTYQYLLDEALSLAPETVDKRQGAIIYDTLAVGDVQLAEGYIQLRGFYIDTNALTASGDPLTLRCAERGVHRYPASPAVKLGRFLNSGGQPVAIPMGARFSTSTDSVALNYAVTSVHVVNGSVVPGEYELTCETAGLVGNDYTGGMLPLTAVTGVATAIMSDLLIPGRDTESDDSLRARYIERVNRPPFGGNIASYKEWILPMDGVGGVQVYPVWNGGGTVKCSIIGADYNPASAELLNRVQTAIDPEQNQGLGYGLAPIGAFVTISTPELETITVDASLTLAQGVTLEQVQSDAETAIRSYFLEQRKSFGMSTLANTYQLHVYCSQIVAALLAISGILNADPVLLNGQDADISLEQGPGAQYLPEVGMVTLHEI
ncbi:MAG: baseplate J/gp47 family protein [Oscillospiraceae bacterium]